MTLPPAWVTLRPVTQPWVTGPFQVSPVQQVRSWPHSRIYQFQSSGSSPTPTPTPQVWGRDPSRPTERYAWVPSYNSQTTANAVQRALKRHRPPQRLPWVVGRGGGWPQASATQTRQKVLILPALIPVAPTPRECPACQLLLCPRARVCVQVTVLTSGALTPCQCPAGVGGILTGRQGARPTDTDARRLLSEGRTGAPLVGSTACTSLGICETGKVPPWAVHRLGVVSLSAEPG